MLSKIVIGPQFQNFTLKCCFLTWHKVSENFDSHPKMGQNNLFYNVFGACVRGECLFGFF